MTSFIISRFLGEKRPRKIQGENSDTGEEPLEYKTGDKLRFDLAEQWEFRNKEKGLAKKHREVFVHK